MQPFPQISLRMTRIFMNSENIKTSDAKRRRLNVMNKMNL